VIGAERGGLMLPRAYVVLRGGVSGSDDAAAALVAFARGRLSPHKLPREIRFVAELPKTASGKVDRRALREVEMGS
jgi:acyl-coenzyme A synthetase/AMP-(fatty) acid ligase